MRLKHKVLNQQIMVRIRNKSEYLLLMKLAEFAGYSWSSGANPTYYNDDSRYTESSEIIVLHEDRTLTRCYARICTAALNECSLKNIVHLQVGDMVRIREDLSNCKPNISLPITDTMRTLAGQVTYITQVNKDPIFNKSAYSLAIDDGKNRWPKKYIELVLPDVDATNLSIGDSVEISDVSKIRTYDFEDVLCMTDDSQLLARFAYKYCPNARDVFNRRYTIISIKQDLVLVQYISDTSDQLGEVLLVSKYGLRRI